MRILSGIVTLIFILEGYDAHCYKESLSGFVQGFRLHFQGAKLDQFSDNLRSAFFEHHPFINLKVFPLSVIPKKRPGEYRMIHHLSYPYGGSVNDGIPPDFCSVHYATVDVIMTITANCATDVHSAFRIIPVHPRDYCLIGMHWKGRYYVDCCLPMGLASSCNF